LRTPRRRPDFRLKRHIVIRHVGQRRVKVVRFFRHIGLFRFVRNIWLVQLEINLEEAR
jgi:hypothetical protein